MELGSEQAHSVWQTGDVAKGLENLVESSSQALHVQLVALSAPQNYANEPTHTQPELFMLAKYLAEAS